MLANCHNGSGDEHARVTFLTAWIDGEEEKLRPTYVRATGEFWAPDGATLTRLNGGGSGIRTHDTRRYTGFQDRRNRPLCHPSPIIGPVNVVWCGACLSILAVAGIGGYR